MRAVARGRTLGILYFDPSRLGDTLNQLRSLLTQAFVGRLEGEGTCDGHKVRFLILVRRGCICAAGLERNGEVIAGQSALAGIATCLSRGSGILEVVELNDVGLNLDLEFNPGIALSEEVSVEEFLSHVKMKISEATRVVEEMGREELEPKPVAPTVTEAPKPPEGAPTVAPSARAPSATGETESLEVISKAIEELEATIPREEEFLETIPEVDVSSLGLPLSKAINDSSERIARDIHVIAPRVIISSAPVHRGKVKAMDFLKSVTKLSSDGSYVAIARLNHRAYYVFIRNGTLCAIVEINEVKLKPLEKGVDALKKLVARSDTLIEFTLWKLEKPIDNLDDELQKCVSEKVKPLEEKPKEAIERVEKSSERVERKRGLLSRLFGRRSS